MSLSLSVWGRPDDTGCRDKSDIVADIVQDDFSNQVCPNIYSFFDWKSPLTNYRSTVKVTWDWFPCYKTGKCVHIKSRCDLHPHPQCIYFKKETGEMVAEDEEGCLPTYKAKVRMTLIQGIGGISHLHNFRKHDLS